MVFSSILAVPNVRSLVGLRLVETKWLSAVGRLLSPNLSATTGPGSRESLSSHVCLVVGRVRVFSRLPMKNGGVVERPTMFSDSLKRFFNACTILDSESEDPVPQSI